MILLKETLRKMFENIDEMFYKSTDFKSKRLQMDLELIFGQIYGKVMAKIDKNTSRLISGKMAWSVRFENFGLG